MNDFATVLAKAEKTTLSSGMNNNYWLLIGCTLSIDAKQVLEIGTGYSTSTQAFSYALKTTGGIIDTCDPVKRFDEKLDDNVILHQVTSQQLLKTWNKPVDILHIDGDHKYEGVKFDFDHFFPFVRKGGLILIHDTNNLKYNGVNTYWQEIRKDYKGIQFPAFPGLGLIQI